MLTVTCGICGLSTLNNLQARIEGRFTWLCVSCESQRELDKQRKGLYTEYSEVEQKGA